MPPATPNARPNKVEFEQVFQELQSIFKQQQDIGAFEIISNWILERRILFDPFSRRHPKPELLIVVSYLLLLAAAFAVFNLG